MNQVSRHTVFISDLHIRETGDKGDHCLKCFLEHPETIRSERVVFLGDIFDYVGGFHPEYFDRFPTFYNGLQSLLERGVEVYFFEGNHDMHLEKLHSFFCQSRNLPERNYFHVKKYIEISWYNHNIRLSHGDDIQLDLPSYDRYKSIISSRIIGYIANELMPLNLLDKLASSQSEKSRRANRGYKREDVEKSYDEGLKRFSPYFDLLIAGHIHFQVKKNINEMVYCNLGFPPADNQFLKLSSDGAEFIELEIE